MTFSLTWLPKVLRDAGLRVEEVEGWKTRGHGDVGDVKGVLCHHTAGALKGNAPSLNIVTKGRPDLPGPLSQLVLGRDGTYYVVAAGRSYHAGAGNWRGVTNGNAHLIGIEAENTGLDNDNPWPSIQMDAYAKGVAAILKRIEAEPIMCVGHLEYALPKGRKSDPSFSVGSREARLKAMEAFRERVAQLMASPDAAPRADAPQPVHRPTLRRGSSGEHVKTLQKALGFTGAQIDGDFGAKTEAAVRQRQVAAGIVPDAIVGPATWDLLK